jgi:putative ABC transport system permease protein
MAMIAQDLLQSVSHDIRLASRSLLRSPGFLIAAVFSLGLAIGAGVSGFSVLDAIRFRGLPFPDAERLVLISEVPPGGCPASCDVNYKTLALLREQQLRSIDALAGFMGGPKSLGSGEKQLDIIVGVVSASLFPLVGAKPELGRTFTADEDRLGAPPVMVIGHDLWTTYFNSDRDILGKTFILSDEPFTVIGVMPSGFEFESRSQVWLAVSRYLDPRTGTSRRSAEVMARLTPGATAEQLTAELQRLEPAANEGRSERARTRFAVQPLRSRYVNAARSRDLIFAAIVAAILLIACANVASLVLVRAMRNRRELAIRTALGGSAARVARYLLIQNLMIATAGMLVGLALAAISLDALRVLAPLPVVRVAGMDYHLDIRAVAFAVALTAVAATLLSIGPVRLLLRTELQETLREGALATTTSLRGVHTQGVFVIVQTACAVALLIATGLMIKTAMRFSQLTLGYDADRVVQITPVPAHAGRVKEKYLPLDDRLLLDFLNVPGVERTALRATTPLGVVKPGEPPSMMLDGTRTVAAGLQPRTASGVSPDYFAVLGIPIVSGRPFALTDAEGTPAVAIINEWAARHWWPGENPLGRTFTVDTAPGMRIVLTVVGVARDNLAAQGSVLLAKPGPEVYRPFYQAHFWVASFFARTRGPSGAIVDAMQRAVMRLVPNGRPNAGLMASQVAGQLGSVRTTALEIAAFAIVGLLLAIVGHYGVLSYVVQLRTPEIGIRGVLGATRGQILGMVMGQALRLAAVGAVVGLATAGLVMRLAKSVLYGTPPADPLVYGGVAGLFLLVALAASYVPALRATRVDPAVAVRRG